MTDIPEELRTPPGIDRRPPRPTRAERAEIESAVSVQPAEEVPVEEEPPPLLPAAPHICPKCTSLCMDLDVHNSFWHPVVPE